MNKQKLKVLSGAVTAVCFLAVVSIAFSACSPALHIKLNEGGGNTLSESEFSLGFSPTTQNFAGAFSGGQSLFDAEKISSAFSNLGFPEPKSVYAPASGNIRLAVAFGEIDLDTNRVFSVETDGMKTIDIDRANKRMEIHFDKKTTAEIIALLPKELFEYSDLMMAPVLTGENITEDEYIELISSAYGTTAGRELQSSFFTIQIDCPGTVSQAAAHERTKNGGETGQSQGENIQTVAKGKSVVFSIPLAKMLVLSNPVTLQASWH